MLTTDLSTNTEGLRVGEPVPPPPSLYYRVPTSPKFAQKFPSKLRLNKSIEEDIEEDMEEEEDDR